MTMVLMKVILVACCIAANVDCRPQQDPSTAQTLRYDFNVDDSGTFEFNVDTSDGFHHDATGYLENVGTEDESLVVKGSYSYTGLDGVEYKVTYLADKNGFQPRGEHIPSYYTSGDTAAPYAPQAPVQS